MEPGPNDSKEPPAEGAEDGRGSRPALRLLRWFAGILFLLFAVAELMLGYAAAGKLLWDFLTGGGGDGGGP